MLQTKRRALVDAHRTERDPHHKEDPLGLQKLCNVETRVRMQALYEQAKEKDYIPKQGEILFFLDAIPPEIGPIREELLRRKEIFKP